MLALRNLDLIPLKSNKILTWASLKIIFGESRIQKCNFMHFGVTGEVFIYLFDSKSAAIVWNSIPMCWYNLDWISKTLRSSFSPIYVKNSHFINQTYLKLIIFGFDSALLCLNFDHESVCDILYDRTFMSYVRPGGLMHLGTHGHAGQIEGFEGDP